MAVHVGEVGKSRSGRHNHQIHGALPKLFSVLLLVVLALLIDRAEGIRWLALRKATGPPWNKPNTVGPALAGSQRPTARSVGTLPASVSAACGRARRSLGLSRAQARLCRRAAETMPLVARAASQTAIACGELFKERRWNCSSLELAPDLAPDLTTGTREQAFVYALSSAAVAFSVARACATGSLFACSCGATPREPPDGNFKWGGCGDNVKYGLQFGKAWADAASAPVAVEDKYGKTKTKDETSGGALSTPQKSGTTSNIVEITRGRRRKGDNGRSPKILLDCSPRADVKKCSKPRGKGRHGGDVGSSSHIGEHSAQGGGKRGRHHQGRRGRRKERRKDRDGARRTLLSIVNLHNNRAGRRAVEWSVSTQCKCHGVSGSCSIKTCWKALPRLSDVGERLKRQYAVATEVVPGRGWIDRQDALAAAASVHGGKQTTLRQHRIKGTDLVALSPLVPPPPPGGRRRRLLQPAATAPASDFNDHHLIYVTKSPDYCLRDPRVGSQGTAGRWCNASSHGHEGCESMCCGRGYRTVREEVVERCQCKYYWCCYVKCKTCRKLVERHRCN